MKTFEVPNHVREAVYHRDGHACLICGETYGLSIHYVIPWDDGGGNTPQNLITLCKCCQGHADSTHSAYAEKLIADHLDYLYGAMHNPFERVQYDAI